MNNTSLRTIIHLVGLAAAAVAAGTITFVGLDRATVHNIIAIAALVNLVIQGYLTSTTGTVQAQAVEQARIDIAEETKSK